MNNTHTIIPSRPRHISSGNNNAQNIDNQFFTMLAQLRKSNISITPKQSNALYQNLLHQEKERIHHEMQKSYSNVLNNISKENAAKTANRAAQSKRNRNLGRANAVNVSGATRKASSRRSSSRRSSGYSSKTNTNINTNTNN
jgi:hypothetical protein